MSQPTGEKCATSAPDFLIVAETDDYVIVDKPPFVLVHPTKPGGPPTLERTAQPARVRDRQRRTNLDHQSTRS
jgi:23S rRNA-/tRNA-specific pseudouridylate synthase